MTQEQKYIDQKFDELKRFITEKDSDNVSIEELKLLRTEIGEMKESIEPIIEWFGHMNWMKTGVLYSAGFIVTIGSAVFTIKTLFK